MRRTLPRHVLLLYLWKPHLRRLHPLQVPSTTLHHRQLALARVRPSFSLLFFHFLDLADSLVSSTIDACSGSALTVFLDIAVLCQFAYFSRQQRRIVLPSVRLLFFFFSLAFLPLFPARTLANPLLLSRLSLLQEEARRSIVDGEDE